jgi:DNA polymerase, archaea type
VLQWSLTESGAEYAVDESYTPTIHVSAHRGGSLSAARAALRDHPAVAHVSVVEE